MAASRKSLGQALGSYISSIVIANKKKKKREKKSEEERVESRHIYRQTLYPSVPYRKK